MVNPLGLAVSRRASRGDQTFGQLPGALVAPIGYRYTAVTRVEWW